MRLALLILLAHCAACTLQHLPECLDRAPTCEVEFAEIDVACFVAGTANRMALQRHEELGCMTCLAPLYGDQLDPREPADGLRAWDEFRRLLDAESCGELAEGAVPW